MSRTGFPCLPLTVLILLASMGVARNRAEGKDADVFWNQDRLIAAAQVGKLDQLRDFARSASQESFVPKPDPVPALAALTYEQFMQIQPKHGEAYWDSSGSPFLIETFHQGAVQQDRVAVFTRDNGSNQMRQFDAARFDYGTTKLRPEDLENAGHAGIKVVGKFEGKDDFEEILTFLGSSYFRARSSGTVYGTSARGLAIDISMPKDEEFPFFRAFWVLRPNDDAEKIEILAYMDSPSCTGAYRFEMHPGELTTMIDVEASLFFRGPVDKVALGPLTSMWMWGDGLRGPSLDERPKVHDSQGLQIVTSDEESIWRPFARVAYPSVSRFNVATVKQFGVWQRDRHFESYLDSNARYESRPSVWVQPDEAWKDGVIELLEIPGAHEGIDNIGAYWIPPGTVQSGSQMDFGYRVGFGSQSYPDGMTQRMATCESFELIRRQDSIDMNVTLAHGRLGEINPSELEIQLATVRGEVINKSVAKKTSTKASEEEAKPGLVVHLELKPLEPAPMEVRMTLRHQGKPVSETLVYLCPNQRPGFDFPAVYTKDE